MLSRWMKRILLLALYGKPCSPKRLESTRKMATLPVTRDEEGVKDYGTETDKNDGWSDKEYELHEQNILPPGRYR